MALTLSASPIKTVNGVLSNVNAAKSQLPYTFSRQDFVIDSSADNGGFLEVVILGALTGIVLADRLYIGGSYNTNGSASAVTVAANTTILTNIPWVAAVGAGSANLLTGVRVDYRVIITVLNALGTVAVFPTPLRYQTRSNGDLFVDLSGLIVPVIEELASSFNYRITYQEFYNGGLQGAPVLHGVVLAVVAYKQQMSNGGSNMAQLLLGLNEAGSILTLSGSNFLHLGWRRTVSVIIDENLTARTGSVGARFEYTAFNINGVQIGVPVLGLTSTEVGIHNELIPDDIRNGAGFVRIRAVNAAGDEALTNSINYKLLPDCANPLMVEWLNLFGAFEQHLFEVNQEVTIEPEEGLIFQRPITQDSEFADRTIGRKVNTVKQKITVQADHLTQSQWLSLNQIKSSDQVLIYFEKGGTRFIQSRVVEGLEGLYTTRQSGASFSFSARLEMPENFDLFSQFTYEAILIDADGDTLVDSDEAILIDV